MPVLPTLPQISAQSKYFISLPTNDQMRVLAYISEPGDLVYKFRKIGLNDFSDQFSEIVIRYKRTGY